MKFIQGSVAAVLLLAGFAAQADGLLKVEQTVFGMDCAPCAYGLQKGLGKLPGASKVDVSLNDGKATVEFAPGSAVSFSQVHAVIVNGGFTPREAVVTVAGHVAEEDGQLLLVAGAGDKYRLVLPPGMDASALKPGAAVTVQGQIPTESVADAVPSLTVQRLLPAAG